MDKPLNVFILAAGLGERLQPVTNHIPKPLLPVLGKPVLQYVLERVSALPVNKIGINLYHKKDVIENWLKRYSSSFRLELFPEETMLGTGGALKNAEAFLGESTFLVHNSDIVSDIDLVKLIESHVSSENLVTLAVHDCPEFNCLSIDKKGFLKGLGKTDKLHSDAVKCLAFTGIAVYRPEFLKFLPPGKSGIVDSWLKALDAGYKVGTLDVSGCYWCDIGTPGGYSSAVINSLKADGETVYIHPSTKGCKQIHLDGYVVIEEQGTLKKGSSLRNCILLPESRTESHTRYENCLLGPGFRIDIKESEFLGSPCTPAAFLRKQESGAQGLSEATLIGSGGSDRKYYRVRKDEKTEVLMQSSDEDTDFQRHIEYTIFFRKNFVPVPELIKAELDKKIAVFEDAGDLTLYSWLKCPRDKEGIEDLYRQVMDVLIQIHTAATGRVSECPLLHNRRFDYEYFRWETGYFIERFVKGMRNIKVRDFPSINKEFHALALKADSFAKTVIHRDFQSQNIMITKDGNLRITDYQGARMGPPAYDLASILWDPYYCLDDNIRDSLLDYYIGKTIHGVKEGDFRKTLLTCRLQRHMQALGAYGFLSSVKGKEYFLKYVPEGLRLLKEDLSLSRDEYPKLYEMVMEFA